MFKTYLKTDKENTFISIYVSYNKGNSDYRPVKRGYYVHVQPVERFERNGVMLESFTAFTGYKQLLAEVGRASKKQENICDGIALDYARPLIARVAQEQNLKVEEF